MESIPQNDNEKEKKDTQIAIKQIETELKQERDAEKIKEILMKLKVSNFEREDIIKSKIILTIKSIKEINKDNKAIESLVLSIVKSWKQIKKRETSYEVMQLNEDVFNLSDINTICNNLIKDEVDSTRKTTLRVLFTTIAESKKAYWLYQDSLHKSKANQTELAFLNKIKQAVIEIESGLYKAYLKSMNQSKYKAQTKTLVARLESNAELIEKILLNKISLGAIATMTSEELMSSEEKEKLYRAKESCFEARRSDWNIVHGNVISTGIYKCGKCKSTNTTYFQIQIRRADEPMTTFVTCSECGNSWKC